MYSEPYCLPCKVHGEDESSAEEENSAGFCKFRVRREEPQQESNDDDDDRDDCNNHYGLHLSISIFTAPASAVRIIVMSNESFLALGLNVG